jgi:hypothetical protein
MGVGVGVDGAGAQSHDDHGHGGHDHPTTTTTRPTTTTTRPTTTTTRPTTTTTRPTTTTTRPGGTTTTTRPQATTTTVRPTTTTTAPGTRPPGEKTTNIEYGPFNIPGAPDNPDGSHGHGHTGNQFQFFVQKPCTDCYVTSMQADLVYPDGRRAGWSTDAGLHHMVMFNSSWGRSDATCGGSFLGFLGERFFASGDERTPTATNDMAGYYVSWLDSWNMIYELANYNSTPQDVKIRMTYKWVPASTPGMTRVDPVWLDIDQCGDSQVAIGAGQTQQEWTWTVNRPGKLLGLGGHVHDHGIDVTVTNQTTGKQLCRSVAGYGESPLYIGHHGEAHISSMSTCQGTLTRPIDTLTNGQRVRMVSRYNAPEPVSDAMGIVIMYVARS